MEDEVAKQLIDKAADELCLSVEVNVKKLQLDASPFKVSATMAANFEQSVTIAFRSSAISYPLRN